MFAYVGTQSDKSHDAVDAVLATLRQPVDDKRFALAKDTLAENCRVDRIAPREIAAAVYRWDDQGEASDPRAVRYPAQEARAGDPGIGHEAIRVLTAPCDDGAA